MDLRSAIPLAALAAASVSVPCAAFAQGLGYDQFLANASDSTEREELWPVFKKAEAAASSFASSPFRWVPIRRVEYAPVHVSGEWSTNGVIQVKPGKGAGLLFHEVFHPAFHKSEFHTSKTDRDGAWAEAFCDAFRYYAEREFLPPPESKWARHIDHLAAEPEAKALKGRHWVTMKYHYPAALIVKRLGGADGSLESLRGLWAQLLELRRQKGGPVMDEFFGYAPPNHRSDVAR